MQHHLQRLLFFVFIAFLSSSGVHAQSGAVFIAVDLDGMICGITSEQEVVCSTHSFEKRFEPPADLPTATAVATGNSFACALLVSGDIQCWGDDNFGVLDAPTAGAPYKAISAGEVHACAIDKDDAIACWGLSNNERLQAPTGSYKQVSASYTSNCAVATDGSVACWGNFDEGNLDVPPDLPAAQKVVVARNTSCALLDDGSVQCWGVPISLPPVAGPYQDIALDYITSRSTNTFCALDLDGRVDCRFYSVTADALLSAAQDSVPTDPGYTDIAVISGYACGVAADGSVDCWGDDRLFITNIPELVVDRVPTVTTATTGLRSEVYSTSTAELFWDGPRTAFQVAGHEIIRNGEVSAFTQNLSSYIVDDLIPGTSTEFSVRRVGINGEIGEPTATITIDSADNSNIDDADGGDGYRAPSRPAETTGLLAEVYSPTALELSWDRAEIGSGVSGYEIRRNGELIAFTRGTSFYNEVATTDRVYRYDVIAIGFNDSQILGFSSIDVAVGSADVGMCR